MQIIKINQKGDTIVEVLIAMTILAAILGACYATANRAMKQSQQSQERMQAIKLAEAQIDRLKYLSDYQPTVYKTLAGDAAPEYPNKCIDSTNTIYGSDSDNCKENNLFNYYLSYYDKTLNQFIIKVTWPSLATNQDEIVELAYRASSNE